MEDGIMLMVNSDGVANVYDGTYNITIHCESAEEQEKCIKMLQGNYWIPADNPPKNNDYILVSFENFSVPQVGRYEEGEEGGSYYLGDEEETCISQDLIVNAWQPLPKQYKE